MFRRLSYYYTKQQSSSPRFTVYNILHKLYKPHTLSLSVRMQYINCVSTKWGHHFQQFCHSPFFCKAQIKIYEGYVKDLSEQNEVLVQTVEGLEQEANGRVASLELKLKKAVSTAKVCHYKNQQHCFTTNDLFQAPWRYFNISNTSFMSIVMAAYQYTSIVVNAFACEYA